MKELEKKFYKEVNEAIKNSTKFVVGGIKGFEDLEITDVKDAYLLLQQLNLNEAYIEAIGKIVEDSIIGAVHTIFVSIDGGTALSDEGKALELIDRKSGKPLTEGALHENFMDIMD